MMKNRELRQQAIPTSWSNYRGYQTLRRGSRLVASPTDTEVPDSKRQMSPLLRTHKTSTLDVCY